MTSRIGELAGWFAVSRELRRKVFVTSAIRVYSAAMQLAVVVITARALGPEGRGVIAAAWSWAAFFALFAALCLGQAAAGIASRGEQKNWLGPALATLGAAAATMTIVGWILALSLWLSTGGAAFGDLPPTTLLVTFGALPVIIWGQYQPYLLTAAGRLDLANRANFVGRSVTPVAAFLAVFLLDFGAEGALVAMALGEGIIALTGTGALIRKARTAIVFVSKQASILVRDGVALLPSTLGWFLIANSQVLIVHTLRGDAETGVYQLAAFAIDALALVGASSALVVYERVAASGADKSWREVRRLIALLIVLTAVMAVAAVPLATWVFPIVFGDRFDPAIPIFLALLPTLLGRLLSALMTPQWIARGFLWQLSALYMMIGVANVMLCAALVATMGSTGAVWSANAAFLAVALCHLGLSRQIDRRSRQAVTESGVQ